MSSMVRNASPWGIFSEQGTAESPSERDPDSTVVGWWQECFCRRGIAAQQAMCGSVRHRDAETTRNKLRTNKSHLQIVGQNRKNGSVRYASVLFQIHDGHSSIILNQLSHFFNQRNSGNILTALRIAIPRWPFHRQRCSTAIHPGQPGVESLQRPDDGDIAGIWNMVYLNTRGYQPKIMTSAKGNGRRLETGDQ